jgi:hypothetical protein
MKENIALPHPGKSARGRAVEFVFDWVRFLSAENGSLPFFCPFQAALQTLERDV